MFALEIRSSTMLLLYLVYAHLLPLVSCKEQYAHPGRAPSRAYHHTRYRQQSHDNRIIPEDREVDVVLHKNHIQKLYFVLDGGYRPISATVTPCSSEIVLEWKISHSPFLGRRDPTYYPPAWSNHVLNPRPVSPSATYVGMDRRSYTNPRAPPGTYTLEMTADDDTRVKVVLTTRPVSEMPFHPPLPPEPAVQIVKVKRNRILVTWKPSQAASDLHYCVSSNHRGNFNSLCSAESSIHTTTTHHKTSTDSNHRKITTHGDHRKITTISDHRKTTSEHPGMTCIGRKTWHTFKNLQRGKTYYFDVFVVDPLTNASSAYVGVSATVRSGHHESTSKLKDDSLATFELDERNGYGVDTKFHMARNSGPLLLFIQSCTGPGPVNVHISHSGFPKQDILSTTVTDVKTLEIPRQMATPTNVSSSLLNIHIRSTTGHQRKVRVWMSGKRLTFPFPTLPQDKGVRVFDTLTTCDAITIGWKTSPDERVKYCIYRQAASDELMERTLSEPQNFCETPTDSSTIKHHYAIPKRDGSAPARRHSLSPRHNSTDARSGSLMTRDGSTVDRRRTLTPTGGSTDGRRNVLCRRYHRFSKKRFNNLIMQKVKNLSPGTTYLFEVQVTKVKGNMLPYEQVWAATLDSCRSS